MRCFGDEKIATHVADKEYEDESESGAEQERSELIHL